MALHLLILGFTLAADCRKIEPMILNMKNLIQLLGALGLATAVCQAQPAFTSLYIFGDGISTTTNNPSAGQYYYGLRRSNGRVWVEVLAQRLGLGANSITNVNWSNSTNNCSFFGQYSPVLITNLNHCAKPGDASTALFVVWVNNADFVGDFNSIYLTGNGTNSAMWSSAVNQSLANHWNIITNLYYGKGARNLVMPNAVDITEIPMYDGYPAADRAFIRQQTIGFNSAFTTLLNQARASLPGIKIYEPDFFTLLDNVLTNATAYGLTNVLYNGVPYDALEAFPKGLAINGAGTNYIFWDSDDPSAKLHEIMADVAQQMICPVQISQFCVVDGACQMNFVNLPVGLNGFVEGCTNMAAPTWTVVQNVNSTSSVQAFAIPIVITIPSTNTPQFTTQDDGPPNPGDGTNGAPSFLSGQQYLRLSFPYAWSWP